MSDTVSYKDPWRIPAFALWEIFFLVGLLPDPIFRLLRQAGAVLPQRAAVNSPYLLTVALAGYLAVFAYNRCRDQGVSTGESADKMVQYGVVALVAFLPVDFVGVLGTFNNILVPNRPVIYVMTAAKLSGWVYLLSLIIRYQLGDECAFSRMPSLFPSTRGGSSHDGGAGHL